MPSTSPDPERPTGGFLLQWVDALDLRLLVPLALLLAAAPFAPQPHLLEKLGMLANGTLSRPIDIFDLFMHASGLVLVALKLGVLAWRKWQEG